MEWVKIRCDILDHRKIKLLRKRPGGNDLALIWMLLIIETGKCNRGGYLMVTDNHPYTAETLSLVLGYSLAKVKTALSAYAELEMIEYRDGVIYIKNWPKYQSEDKLAAKREKDRIRQQNHRANEPGKVKTSPLPDSMSRDSHDMSRDSHADMSRDVTQENRQQNREENRYIKTTTDNIRLLLCDTPLEKISDGELDGLVQRHGMERLLEAADIAAETWRRTSMEVHNPGGYLQSLCTALVVPDWYVPHSERTRSPPPDSQAEADQCETDGLEEAEDTARDAVWASLPGTQQEEYVAMVNANRPKGIDYSQNTLLMLAKGRAWDESRSGGDG
ncbi:MAG TPA: replication protein [Desulfobulbaceae bacterium]|nr:replication protein [Desulfobulbaceae bacterium]